MPLSIVEPNNKLVILGSVAGVLATVVLLVALYAPHSCASFAPRRRRRALPACTFPLVCSYVLMKHGTAKAKAIVVAVLKGEVKTAWSLATESFDFAGDTAIFIAIKEDAENPIYKAGVASIIMPVRPMTVQHAPMHMFEGPYYSFSFVWADASRMDRISVVLRHDRCGWPTACPPSSPPSRS
jgi:hypothetical protein